MDARELEDGDGQSAAAEDLDAAVAGLYRLPLAEFVAACDRLVRQLRAAVDRSAAGRVAVAGYHRSAPRACRRRALWPCAVIGVRRKLTSEPWFVGPVRSDGISDRAA